MKGRDIVIGAALGIWLVVLSSGQHVPVRPHVGQVALAPSPSATSTASRLPAPEKSAVGGPRPASAKPVAPAEHQGQGARQGVISISASDDWLIVVACVTAIAVSVSAVTLTIRGLWPK